MVGTQFPSKHENDNKQYQITLLCEKSLQDIEILQLFPQTGLVSFPFICQDIVAGTRRKFSARYTFFLQSLKGDKTYQDASGCLKPVRHLEGRCSQNIKAVMLTDILFNSQNQYFQLK